MCSAWKLTLAVMAVSWSPAVMMADHKYHGGALEAREHGYEHGYRNGLHEGLKDREHRDKYKPEVKDADAGYEKYMGDKDRYKDGYRTGFRAGYDDAFYNRSGRLGEIYGPFDDRDRMRGSADRYDDVYVDRGWGASDVAYDIGYRDGLIAGEQDVTDRRTSVPEEHKDFRNADHGYRSGYGDKGMYQRLYRDGYVQGYRDGVRRIR